MKMAKKAVKLLSFYEPQREELSKCGSKSIASKGLGAIITEKISQSG
jgi:hypothetical protein